MGCSSVGGASSAANTWAAASTKPKQALAASIDVQIDVIAQLASGSPSDNDSGAADDAIDVTA